MNRYQHLLMCGCKYISPKWLDVARCAFHDKASPVVKVEVYTIDPDGKRTSSLVPADGNGLSR